MSVQGQRSRGKANTPPPLIQSEERFRALIGRSGFELVGAAHLPLLQEQFETVVSSPGRTQTIEHPLLHKEGSVRWLKSTVTNWQRDPRIGEIVSNFHDITARRQAESALAAENQALGLLAQEASTC